MKNIIKELVKSVVISIGIAMVIFCIVGIIFDIANNGNFKLEGYQFTKMVLGCIVIGFGFGVPSIVYNKENLPMPIKIIIHMGIGCITYTIVAYLVGWIGFSSSIIQGIMMIIIQILIAFIIWLGFFVFYRKEARRLNDRLQELRK